MDQSIGILPEEFEAFECMKLLLGLGYGMLLFLTMVQIVSFYLYNGSWHPLAEIIGLSTQGMHPYNKILSRLYTSSCLIE